MLPRQYRLPLRTEFKRIKKEGRIIQGRFFSLLICPQLPITNCQLLPSRFAFIVSKKISPLASRRNRIRRLLSEAIYSFLSKIKPGFDFVFLIKKTIIGKNLVEIKREVESLLINEKFFIKTN